MNKVAPSKREPLSEVDMFVIRILASAGHSALEIAQRSGFDKDTVESALKSLAGDKTNTQEGAIDLDALLGELGPAVEGEFLRRTNEHIAELKSRGEAAMEEYRRSGDMQAFGLSLVCETRQLAIGTPLGVDCPHSSASDEAMRSLKMIQEGYDVYGSTLSIPGKWSLKKTRTLSEMIEELRRLGFEGFQP